MDTLRLPMQARAVRTRAQLVEAASEEFGARGYALTTTKSIADRAGVGTGTFYRYFPDKDVVLRELASQRVQWLLDQTATVDPTPPPAATGVEALAQAVHERLRRVVKLYVDYHRHDKGLHAVISERRLCDPELDGIMATSEREAVARFARALRAWGHEGDSEATAFMMFSLLEGAVHGHVLTQPMLNDARFVNGLVEALMRIGVPQRSWNALGDLRAS